MSAQQEQDEAVLDALRAFDAEESAAEDSSKPSFADGSPVLQEIKKDLRSRGMSDEEAEAYIRTI